MGCLYERVVSSNMSKDKNLLWGVSDLFTEKTLEDILSKICKEKDVKVLSWDFGEASNKGDGYLSTVNRVKVKGEANGKPIETSLVVKSLPRNIARRKSFRSAEFFRNEIAFYVDIYPKFREFLKSKGHNEVLNVPRCLAAVSDGENDFIALEDVSVYGFGPVTRQSTLTFAENGQILKALARFHAVSFAYKDQRDDFKSLSDKLNETYYSPAHYDWYEVFQGSLFRIARDALAQEYGGTKVEEVFNAQSRKGMFYAISEFCARKDAPTSVITQGDAWAPNFLIQRGKDGNDVALALDFQLARCSSPVLDISFCIYSCTEKSLRDEHYDDLLRIYHKELSDTISLLGSDPQKVYPWDVFMKEVQEQSLLGLNFALEAIPFALLDSSEAFDLDLIKGEEKVNISVAWPIGNIKSKEGRLRLADVIAHAVEKNFF
ncbi:uncharacterized protein LOC105689818 isoform X1 [Athalia rosae]|uniref:uncharacterized protein LOC105689818 isoform X1 n=2 Tax=Athalia rosae TaxID=37344 RepID=UPI00203364E9|nr:uncharacterized protein LOC105689818 isoform X1 [Athalia rosae]XP_048508444.1 uncharacterized protein LOC105689818 isoform X1 [Athalia rosae]